MFSNVWYSPMCGILQCSNNLQQEGQQFDGDAYEDYEEGDDDDTGAAGDDEEQQA